MTALKKIEQGVEVENGKTCRGCKLYMLTNFSHIKKDMFVVNSGVCTNPKSDHYQHVVTEDHPACEESQ